MLIARLFTIARRTWKEPKCPLTDKEDTVHIHKGILKNEIIPFSAT